MYRTVSRFSRCVMDSVLGGSYSIRCIRPTRFHQMHVYTSTCTLSVPPHNSFNWDLRSTTSIPITSLFSKSAIENYVTLQRRGFSDKSNKNDDMLDGDEKNLTVFQRFKRVYKEHGKTLIAVHIVTSIAWYGAFYLIAKR